MPWASASAEPLCGLLQRNPSQPFTPTSHVPLTHPSYTIPNPQGEGARDAAPP